MRKRLPKGRRSGASLGAAMMGPAPPEPEARPRRPTRKRTRRGRGGHVRGAAVTWGRRREARGEGGRAAATSAPPQRNGGNGGGRGRPWWAGNGRHGGKNAFPGFYFACHTPGWERARPKPPSSRIHRPLVASRQGLRLVSIAVPCLAGRRLRQSWRSSLRRSAAVTSSRRAFHDQE